MSVVVDIIIENDELQKYFKAMNKKAGVCRHLPSARFTVTNSDRARFDCLVCSDKMGGKQTGVGAETCTNCTRDKDSQHG